LARIRGHREGPEGWGGRSGDRRERVRAEGLEAPYPRRLHRFVLDLGRSFHFVFGEQLERIAREICAPRIAGKNRDARRLRLLQECKKALRHAFFIEYVGGEDDV